MAALDKRTLRKPRRVRHPHLPVPKQESKKRNKKEVCATRPIQAGNGNFHVQEKRLEMIVRALESLGNE